MPPPPSPPAVAPTTHAQSCGRPPSQHACAAEHGVDRCAVHFEQLGPRPNDVFFHCDQLIRGMYRHAAFRSQLTPIHAQAKRVSGTCPALFMTVLQHSNIDPRLCLQPFCSPVARRVPWEGDFPDSTDGGPHRPPLGHDAAGLEASRARVAASHPARRSRPTTNRLP